MTRRLFTKDEIALHIDNIKSDGSILELRTAEKIGKYIQFCNGSYLDINDTQYTKYTTYKYDYNNCFVLIVYQKYDNIDEYGCKTLYYLIEK